MLLWLWKALVVGFGTESNDHVCDEFTQWEPLCDVRRVVSSADGKALPEGQQYDVVSYFWQQRRCTICGWIEQERLTFDGIIDDDDED